MEISQSTEAIDSHYFPLQIVTRVLMIWAVCLSKVLFIKSRKTFKLWLWQCGCIGSTCVMLVDDWIVLLARAESGSGSMMLNANSTEWLKKESPVTKSMPSTSYAISFSAWVNCQVWAPFNSLGWVNSLFLHPQLFLVWMQCLPGTYCKYYIGLVAL